MLQGTVEELQELFSKVGLGSDLRCMKHTLAANALHIRCTDDLVVAPRVSPAPQRRTKISSSGIGKTCREASSNERFCAAVWL